MLNGYYEQLLVLCRGSEAELRRACAKAGVPSSTFYRAKHGQELRFSTAQKIASHIQKYDSDPDQSLCESSYPNGGRVLQRDDRPVDSGS